MDIAKWQAGLPGLPRFLGMEFTHIEKDRVVAELTVRPELCTEHNTIHGGGIMAYADTMGAIATMVNLKEGQVTTTIESKTNFFAAIPIGDTAKAECIALHRGRTTMVWQTRITRNDGRLCAMVTQTQMVLERKK